MAENIEGLDDEQVELLPKFMKAALDGFHVPRIGLRYRLQTDVHGLDLSRHRLLEDAGVLVVELDVHAAPAPQVIGAVMAAAAMGPTTRRKALRAIDAAIAQPGVIPEPFLVRRLLHGVPSERPPMAASGPVGPINGVILPDAAKWAGVPSERRWAMEVLGIGAEMKVDRTRHPEAVPPAAAHRAPGPRRRVGRRRRTDRRADRSARAAARGAGAEAAARRRGREGQRVRAERLTHGPSQLDPIPTWTLPRRVGPTSGSRALRLPASRVTACAPA